MSKSFKLYKGQVLIIKQGYGKPKQLKVLTNDCEMEHLIRLQKEDGTTCIMPKATLFRFYKPAKIGEQLSFWQVDNRTIFHKHIKVAS